VKPRLHVFGHIHEGAGVTESGGTIFVNASSVTERYRPVNPAIVIDLDV
jgi:Icc-related predicted phosphoesterase